MNRGQTIPAFLQLSSCPDCNSELDVAVTAPGVLRITVRHDATCPTYRAMTRRTR